MSAMDLLLDQVQTWELPTGACPFLKTCTKALQFSPKWRCNFLHFYFATFGTFILQQTNVLLATLRILYMQLIPVHALVYISSY